MNFEMFNALETFNNVNFAIYYLSIQHIRKDNAYMNHFALILCIKNA